MQTLGKYRIVKELGHGGFGTVYLAEDTSLDNRPVALKVLYPQLLVDPDTIQLFGKEAGVTARLVHHHIVAVYEAGDIGGTRFIAMQYVPGRSLQEVIEEEGPQPLERVAEWLEQIASALDYAHGEGVLHRDIKPSNILLDREDRAMVTDFGLAKAVQNSGGSVSSKDKEIMTGTAKYMAPEQAKGKPVPQSDIYSLGVVLYELLTGKVPFEGDDPFAIAIRHMTEEPVSPREHRPDLPEPVETVVLKAMAKQPAARFLQAGDLAGAFRVALEAEAKAKEQAREREKERELEAMRRQHESELAEAKRRAEEAEAARQRTEAESARQKQEAAAIQTPPDPATPPPPRGRKRMWPAAGLAAIILIIIGIVWSIRACSGEPPIVAIATATPTFPSTPTLTRTPRETQSATRVLTPSETSAPEPLATSMPAVEAGCMAFIGTDNNVWVMGADGSDPRSLETGDACCPRWSPDGERIVYRAISGGSNHDIYVMNADGSGKTRLTTDPNWDWAPAWSPDGTQIAFISNREGQGEIYIMTSSGENPVNITRDPSADWDPVWSPDGGKIAFPSNRSGTFQIWVMNTDGTELQQLTSLPGEAWVPSWSPDGRQMVFHLRHGDQTGIWLINADGSNARQITFDNDQDPLPEFSPDGKLIAFSSKRSGREEIYLMNSNGTDQRQITNFGASQPHWCPATRKE